MSVEALFSLDQAVSNIRNFQADVAEQVPHDVDAMNYLLRTEHQVPGSLDSIARYVGDEVARAERFDQQFFKFTSRVVIAGSQRPRHLTLMTPAEPSSDSARVEIHIDRLRGGLPFIPKVPRELLWLGLHSLRQAQYDHAVVGGQTFHPHLMENQGERYVGIFHGFTRGVARLSGAVVDAIEQG